MVQCTTFALSSYKVVRLIHKDCGKKPKYFVSSLLFEKKFDTMYTHSYMQVLCLLLFNCIIVVFHSDIYGCEPDISH